MRFAAAAILFILGHATAFADEKRDVPEDLVFDVYRNDGDEPFGTHAIRFSRTADGALQVDTTVRLKVKLGFIPVFKYEHDATEIWRDGRFVSLTARTNDDGDKFEMRLDCGPETCVQEAPEEARFEAPLFPGSHWNREALQNPPLYNTAKGGVLDVAITNQGSDSFTHAGETVMGERFAIEGSVRYELYFEGERLQGARFFLRGNTLSYLPSAGEDAAAS